jgi:hypothetical protein
MSEVKQVSLSADELQKLIAAAVSAAVTAAKAPNELEQAKLDQAKQKIQDDLDARRQTAGLIKKTMDNAVFHKSVCPHENESGHSTSVFITDEIGGYLLCQLCRAVIRPEQQFNAVNHQTGELYFDKDFREKRKDVFFDTGLFNKELQKSARKFR